MINENIANEKIQLTVEKIFNNILTNPKHKEISLARYLEHILDSVDLEIYFHENFGNICFVDSKDGCMIFTSDICSNLIYWINRSDFERQWNGAKVLKIKNHEFAHKSLKYINFL